MNSPDRKQILIIEDEAHIAQGLQLNLSLKGYDVMVAENGSRGLAAWKAHNPDLIVLDIMLPGMDGLSVLQHIRLEDEKIPILILSAKKEPIDKRKGLTYGVDDYLTKPFDLEEFLLRVDRLLTRASWSKKSAESLVPTRYTFGNNQIDFSLSQAVCRQGTIQLTDQEVKLLKLFITHQNRPLARKTLLEIGWGYTGDPSTRTVDNFIVRFRKYFEDDPRKPKFFKSMRSVGYVFTPHPEA
ncbi:response regulator transcription factor [Desulfosudis oleivorans]|uniref:Two component transcriptional regulator, winged helix family n=1 Tax=Desulfosudis oleivorans (strain DSM 6200 / JCM 39069 / Hxd3) TaxID=96561 RepID=A8ZUL9_DESOH|nr:response regulator transcription factor [Desulfosudis oleivorans]ABW66432.1 two component transcriptional regulator, winged helix family [Desulfosudis oleivorans Hxd3]